MSKKTEANPNRHMGKTTGYELINGEYHIAPLYQKQFDALAYKSAGISQMLKMVSKHAAEDLEEITKMQQRVWAELAEDIGIKVEDVWYYSNGIIKQSVDFKERRD